MRRRVWVLGSIVSVLGLIALLSAGDDARYTRITYTLPALKDVLEIKVERGAQTLTLTQINGEWLIEPGNHALDKQARRELIGTLSASVMMDQSLRAAELDAAKLGLGPQAPWINLKTKEKVVRFQMGKLVDGRHTFISPANEEVAYRARANLQGVFGRPFDLWRDRVLFERQYRDMAAVERRQGDRLVWRAERADPKSPWRLVTPAGLDAGQKEIDAVANTLATLRADGFLGATHDHAPTYSLMGQAFDGARFGIALESTNGPQIRGRVIPGDAFVSLPRSQVSFLDAQASDLRNRRLFDLAAQDIRELVIPRTPRLHLRRTEAGDWNVIIGGRPTPADADRVNAFVEWIVQIRSAGFPARVPADAFTETAEAVLIRDARERQITVYLGREYRNGAHFVRTSSRPETAYILSPTALGRLATSAKEFIAGP